MMKLAWQLANDKETLWVQSMRATYQCGSQLLPKINHKSIYTNVWKAIVRIWNRVEDIVEWSVRDGHSTRFWREMWIPGSNSLDSYILQPIPESEIEFPTPFYADLNG